MKGSVKLHAPWKIPWDHVAQFLRGLQHLHVLVHAVGGRRRANSDEPGTGGRWGCRQRESGSTRGWMSWGFRCKGAMVKCASSPETSRRTSSIGPSRQMLRAVGWRSAPSKVRALSSTALWARWRPWACPTLLTLDPIDHKPPALDPHP